jgi:hypothetical protein
VALHAVALGVATGAALESLARSLAVLEEPERLAGVERRVAAAGGSGAVRLMAVAAEDLGVVTACAIALPPVRLGRVPDEEVRWVEPALALAAVAIAAELSGMAPFARELATRGCGTVRCQESGGMHTYRDGASHHANA